MPLKLSDFWTWQGRVGRAKYVLIGVVLFAIKHNLDRIIASAFGFRWSVFNYWILAGSDGVELVSPRLGWFYAALVAAALPFIYIGVVLTIRRLRDAALPLWLVPCFFLPFINLFFFLILAIIPSARSTSPGQPFYSPLRRVIPDNEIASAALGVLATAALSVLVAIFSAEALEHYGWGLFVGIPFFLGLNSVLIYSVHRPQSLGRCILVATLAVVIAGLLLFAFAIEGLICLAMAMPLALVVALFGGFIGYVLQQRDAYKANSLHVVSLVFLLMPCFVLLESSIESSTSLYEVKTEIVINAKPERVWKHVVAFAELPPPTEALFKTGIAYPTRARIEGHGVGATRYCMFSTGEFVEPITEWDEPRLLQFDVSGQPPVMNEWSVYRNLQPPHLENYLTSRKGQFLLTALPDGTTRLEGTTWYQNRFWPAAYWHLWSDFIIHRIHMRVLFHIKHLSEVSQ